MTRPNLRIYCHGVLTDAYRLGRYIYCGRCHRKIKRWVWPV